MRTLFLLMSFCFSSPLWAFPEMIRHGYTSCTSCHLSPSGGGVLTDYGKVLSQELLSTWGNEGEERWHHGLIQSPPDTTEQPRSVLLGGDFRALQLHTKNEQVTMGRFIRMQTQLEVAAQILKSTWASVQVASDPTKTSHPWHLPSFYITSQINKNWQMTLGHIMPRFGVNNSEHPLPTRGPIGFGMEAQRDTLEMMYTSKQWDVSLATTFGQNQQEEDATGLYSQWNYNLSDTQKWGLSLEKRFSENKALSLGIHALLGWKKKYYLLTDTVWRQISTPQKNSKSELFHFAKLGYEWKKGFHLIALEDSQSADLSLSSSTKTTYGVGLAFYPRPHFEFQGVIAKKKDPQAPSSSTTDYAYFLMHYYL